jgi:hypothetical protein
MPDSSKCVDNMNMLSVIATTGLTGLSSDGLLGLAPSNQRTRSKVFINELYSRRIID